MKVLEKNISFGENIPTGKHNWSLQPIIVDGRYDIGCLESYYKNFLSPMVDIYSFYSTVNINASRETEGYWKKMKNGKYKGVRVYKYSFKTLKEFITAFNNFKGPKQFITI